MAISRVRRFPVRSRRQTDWALSVSTVALVNVPAASKVLASSFDASVLRDIAPATVIRTRGELLIITDNFGATEVQLGAFGIAFVNNVARTLGVTAIPGPGTDALFDGWFVHQFIQQKSVLLSGVGFESRSATRYVIDSKAMRKFDADLGLAIMIENQHASQGFDFALGLRFLIKAG